MLARLPVALALLATLAPRSTVAAPTLWAPEWNPSPPFSTTFGNPFTTRYNDRGGNQKYDYFLFEPKTATPAPVLVYFHGADDQPFPTDVRKQMEVYVRAGATVVWLRLCNPNDGWACLGNLAQQPSDGLLALGDALARLNGNGHVPPALTAAGKPKLMFVSHSMGGMVAMRAASLAGKNGSPLLPQAVVMHDPAGELVLGFLPLEKTDLAGIPASMLQIALVAQNSVNQSNSKQIVTRVHNNTPATRRFTWVVPHACAHQIGQTFSYGCPAQVTQDVTSAADTLYLSAHDATLNVRKNGNVAVDQNPSAHARVSIIDHTAACIHELASGTAQADCSGSAANYTGVFLQPPSTLVPAPLKYPYFPTVVPPPPTR